MLLKKRLWHRCSPVNFTKFLRLSFLQNNSRRLLLKRFFECIHLMLNHASSTKLYWHVCNRMVTMTHFLAFFEYLWLCLSLYLKEAMIVYNSLKDQHVFLIHILFHDTFFTLAFFLVRFLSKKLSSTMRHVKNHSSSTSITIRLHLQNVF